MARHRQKHHKRLYFSREKAWNWAEGDPYKRRAQQVLVSSIYRQHKAGCLYTRSLAIPFSRLLLSWAKQQAHALKKKKINANLREMIYANNTTGKSTMIAPDLRLRNMQTRTAFCPLSLLLLPPSPLPSKTNDSRFCTLYRLHTPPDRFAHTSFEHLCRQKG